jgi:hypothetical protein
MTQLSVDNPDQWVRELLVRAPQAKASSSMRNLPYKMLSDGEAKAMGQQFGLLDTNKQMRFLSQVGTQLDKDSIRVLMGQIAQGKQGIAAVGDLMYAPPGSTQGGEQRDQTAEYILLGTKLMNRPKGGNTEDEKGAYRQQMPTMRDAFDVLGSMSDFKTVSPEFSTQLQNQMEVVMAHYVGKMTKAGVSDFTIKNHKTEFQASVNAVFGKPEKIGESKVIVPWGMPNSEFAEAVRQRVPMQWGAYSLRQPLTAPSNIYEVVQGNTIVGAIDVSKPVAPKPAAAQTIVVPRTPGGSLPAQFQGVRTYSDRTGMGFYEQSNKELYEMVEGNVRTNIDKMTEGLR